MQNILRKMTAMFLAGLLMLGTVGLHSFALQQELPSPRCRLGTTPTAMLAGGGNTVETDRGVFYLDVNASIRLDSEGDVIVDGPVAHLNYENGVLYYARMLEGAGFHLCSFDLDSGREMILQANIPGKPGQLYLVDGAYLDYSTGDEIWQLELSTGVCSLLRRAERLRSFVPTGCGLIYATGSLFDYTLMAEEQLLAEHAESFFVDFERSDGTLVYALHSEEQQLSLSDVFAGTIRPVEFAGYERPADEEAEEKEDEQEEIAEEAWPEEEGLTQAPAALPSQAEQRLQSPHGEANSALPQLPEVFVAEDPNDPQSPNRSADGDESASEEDFAPVRSMKTLVPGVRSDEEGAEPLLVPRAPKPVPVVPNDGALRREVSEGVMNIVRRCRQMLNIRWTPRKDFASWGYALNYQEGVTYTGLPSCQGCSYVPWDTGLDEFMEAVNDPDSKLYSARTTYGRTGPYYGTDCSGFASWAWDMGRRGTTYSMKKDARVIYVGKNYLELQLGDALLSDTHIMLVTDITYQPDGSIQSVEISHASNTHSSFDCCNSMSFSGTEGLLQIKKTYLDRGYGIYRYTERNNVSYSHSCTVPLEGDPCDSCGVAAFFRQGIDVSYWQHEIDWQKVSAEVSFAILRVGYTGSVNPVAVKDSTFDFNAAGCEANGIPYGVYYYAGATTREQAVEEAEAVLEFLGARAKNGALRLPVFYDVEERANILKLSEEELIEVVSGFCSTLEEAGLRVGIYSSSNIWNASMTDEAYNSWTRWVAQWNPNGLDVGGGAHVWQYSAQGSIEGIDGLVDLDYWFGSFDNTEHCYVTQNSTVSCTEDGVLSATCVHCDQQNERRIPAFGHEYCDNYCTRCGRAAPAWDRFEDIQEGKWYSDSVEFVTQKNLFNGMSRTFFGKDEEMTRAMLIAVLYRLAKVPEVEETLPFDDLKENAYYVPGVVWGVQNGIVYGTGGRQFSPGLSVTREQMTTFLYRFLMHLDSRELEDGDLGSFADRDKVSKFARESMAWAIHAGIIRGKNVDGQLCIQPQSPASRAEVAVMLERFVGYLDACGIEY